MSPLIQELKNKCKEIHHRFTTWESFSR